METQQHKESYPQTLDSFLSLNQILAVTDLQHQKVGYMPIVYKSPESEKECANDYLGWGESIATKEGDLIEIVGANGANELFNVQCSD